MAEADQLRDTVHSGMDQYDRLAIWGRRGARVVDFHYVQPPLSAENAPTNELILSVIGRSEENLPAALLRSHMQGFFELSVAKGSTLDVPAPKQLALQVGQTKSQER